jgi:MarR family transcriptional regulator, transcriptional regulator for hemolysin
MKSVTRRPPNDTLGYLVLDIGRLLSARFDARARDLGVTRAQWTLLAALVRAEGSSQAQLAELMDLAPISVGRLVDRMERAGWVTRRIQPEDRRSWRLYLTRKAHALRPRLRSLSLQLEDEALAELSPTSRRQVLSGLKAVRATLAGDATPRGPGGRRA